MLTLFATLAAADGLELKRDDDLTKKTREMEPVTFDFTLTYDGAQRSSIVDVRLFDEPQGWTHTITGRSDGGWDESADFIWLTMDKGEAAEVSITVVPGGGCRGGLYILTAFASVEGELSLQDTCDFHVGVPDVYGHASRLIDHPSGAWSVRPGSSVLVWTEIENTGNIDDCFEVVPSIKEGEGDWSVVVFKGLKNDGYTPVLLPGSTCIVTCKVSIPSGAAQASWCVVLVKVVPDKGKEDLSSRVMARVAVDRSGTLTGRLEGGSSLTIDPQEVMNLTAILRVTNWRTMRVQVTTVVDQYLETGDLEVSISPSTIELRPGEDAELGILVEVLPGCRAGTYLLAANLSTGGLTENVWIEMEVRVQQVHEILIEPHEQDLTIDLGYTPRFYLRVTNEGNGPTLVYVWPHVIPLGWRVYLSPPRVYLKPGEEATVEFHLVLPRYVEPDPRGPIEMQFRVEELDGDAELMRIYVYIPGWIQLEWMGGDALITGPDRLMAPLNTVHGTLRHVSGTPQRTSMEVKCCNIGPVNATAVLDVTCEGIGYRAWFTSDVVFLVGEGQATVELNIEFDEVIPAGTYTVSLSLTALEMPEGEARIAPFTIDVIVIDVGVDVYGFRGIDPLDPWCPEDRRLEEGRVLSFKYSVEDLGEHPAEDVVLELFHDQPNGTVELVEKRWLPNIVGGFQEYSFAWVAKDPGRHAFTVQASAPDQVNDENDRVRFWFDVKVAPDPNGGDGNSGDGNDGGNGGGDGNDANDGGNGGGGSNDGGANGDPLPGPGAVDDDPFLYRVSQLNLLLILVVCAVFASATIWRYRQVGREWTDGRQQDRQR